MKVLLGGSVAVWILVWIWSILLWVWQPKLEQTYFMIDIDESRCTARGMKWTKALDRCSCYANDLRWSSSRFDDETG